MSFILDALKKSENERQQSAVRRISEMPTVIHRNKAPLWMIGMIIGLTAGVFLLGWAWLNDVRPLNQTVDVVAENSLGQSPQVSLTEALDPTSLESENNLGLELESDLDVPIPEQPLTAESSPVTLVPDTSTIPSMSDLLSYGVQIPGLTLELHVFSPSPADRFVFINSSKYLEGENITEETNIIEITEEGVIIAHETQLFLLPRQ